MFQRMSSCCGPRQGRTSRCMGCSALSGVHTCFPIPSHHPSLVSVPLVSLLSLCPHTTAFLLSVSLILVYFLISISVVSLPLYLVFQSLFSAGAIIFFIACGASLPLPLPQPPWPGLTGPCLPLAVLCSRALLSVCTTWQTSGRSSMGPLPTEMVLSNSGDPMGARCPSLALVW